MAIIDFVKYNGGPDVFAWKYPNEELSTWTQLIVNESQKAVLFKGGKAFDVFEAGRHTLSTENIPLIRAFYKIPFGGRSPFTAEIWYVNTAYTLDVKWGTPTPIQIQDPKYGVFVPVSSNGAFGIRVTDPKAFLTKLVGTQRSFDRGSITRYFRGLYITKVKDTLSAYIARKDVSVLEINAYIDELSNVMKEKIAPVMSDYGIELTSFHVNDISVPEEDPAVKKLKSALAKRAEMNIIGYSYQEERSFDTLEGAATNKGGGSQLMGAGIGLGMGAVMGRTVGAGFGDIAGNVSVSHGGAQKTCPKCHAVISAGQRFCGMCGADTEAFEKNAKKNVVCSACGEPLNGAKKFCPECGHKLDLCPECGADIPEGAEECPSCGKGRPMTCPDCGTAIPTGSKFCPECGHSFVKKCPSCGAVLTAGSKFCNSCGEKI